MGKGTDFDFAIYNADTDKEYSNDYTIKSRLSSVIARRSPPKRPGHGNAQQYVGANLTGTKNHANPPFTAHVDWRGGGERSQKILGTKMNLILILCKLQRLHQFCPVVNVTLKLRVWLQCLLLRTSSGKRLKRQWLQGINGQLPNLDLINTVAHIVRWTGSCPVTIHSEPLEPSYPSYLPDHPGLQRYLAGRTIVKQMSYGFTGSPSGPEGLFSTYGIDAISLFAHPADGPHGFQTLGTIIESSLRSLNNLLERLTIKGLAKWGIANQEWEKHSLRSLISSEKPRPEMSHFKNQKGEEIVWSLAVIGFTHLVGAIVYTGLIRFIDPNQAKNSFQLYLSLLILTSLPLLILKFNPPRKEKTGMIFEPIQLMLSGCFISVISVLNFPLGVRIGFLLSIHPFTVIAWVATTLAFFSPNFDLSLILSNHSVLDAWFLPVFVILIGPLLIHSVIVRLLRTLY
ncbi:hypothetical protein Pst134EA_011161 [Puccinia striiformis f. sp. tritici]|uniref:hypothetical protein n=1 Tax=Puccinia striiformis f. sp. tritici TaxID=168172 RepID=UPI0020075AFB|nr:hypothetical protein Pst134EA_011161 [Puccinia striiformis f. sp. tritici]KAH9467520.1 hypothetical protein Pst134EA_011161 [Puccinia striiformis f. sp. tritici]